MAIVINGNGIDMGDKPISNVSIDNPASVVDKAYVDDLKTITTGTATFNSTTNNINLTGIGIGVEIGDVIQISGAEDTKNNSEFTVEVITDNNNIIVNQVHANKGTTKNVANRSEDTDVTVKLLAKWYNAPIGLGQTWVSLTANRSANVTYTNNTGRSIMVNPISTSSPSNSITITIDGIDLGRSSFTGSSAHSSIRNIVPNGSTYMVLTTGSTIAAWYELR